MKDCVFCKIVRGDLPCDAIHDDEWVMAFLDIAPLAPGHALIIPKQHHTSITTLPPAAEPESGETIAISTDGGVCVRRS